MLVFRRKTAKVVVVVIEETIVAAEEVAARLAGRATPRQLDSWLWTRGGRPEYKAHPRHRTRCVYY